MDTEHTRKLIANATISQTELERLFKQAIAAGQRDLAFDIREVIDERFGLAAPVARHDGADGVLAIFRDTRKSFAHAVDAYLWLVERFIGYRPTIFTDVNWETTGFIAVGLGRNSQGKPFRNYFAKSPMKLFRKTPKLANNPSMYARLQNGWHANTNLSNAEKYDILIRFAGVLGFKQGEDWDFVVHNPSEALQERLSRPHADDLLAELDRWSSDSKSPAQSKNNASS
jgi:hypothetical protein